MYQNRGGESIKIRAGRRRRNCEFPCLAKLPLEGKNEGFYRGEHGPFDSVVVDVCDMAWVCPDPADGAPAERDRALVLDVVGPVVGLALAGPLRFPNIGEGD